MYKVFVIVSLLLFCACSWRVLAARNTRDYFSFDTIQADQLVEENDGDLADRDVEDGIRRNNENPDYDFSDDKDDDIFFSEDDDAVKETKSNLVDSIDWHNEGNDDKLQDDTEDNNEKSFLNKLLQKIKNLLHKVGKRD